MEFSWSSHGVLMEFSWSSHGVLMEFSWRYYGVPVGFSCSSHVVLMEFSWSSHGVLMEFSWSSHGVLMESSWSSHGVLRAQTVCWVFMLLLLFPHRVITGFSWSGHWESYVSYGVLKGSHGFLTEFSCDFLMKLSLCSPWVLMEFLGSRVFMMFLQFSHRVFMGCPVPLFIRNNTLPLQTLLSLHSYYGCNCIFVFNWCGSCHEGME